MKKKLIKCIIIIFSAICFVGLYVFSILVRDNKVTPMTDVEKELLCMTYGNDERIMEGKLTKRQKEGLKELRMATDYLEEKYPGYELNFFYFSNSTSYHKFCRLEFLVDGCEDYFTVQIAVTDDGYIIRDDFYGYVLGPVYNEMLTEKFAEAGLENFVVHTRFGGYVGKEVDASISLDDFTKYMKDKNVNVYVFVDMPGDNEYENLRIKSCIEEQLIAIGNQGYHSIYFATGITDHCSTWKEGFEYSRIHNGVEIEFNIR